MAELTDDPRSCPYCGYEYPEIMLEKNGVATVYCRECGSSGGRRATETEAWDAWNRRVGSAVDGAREALAIAAKVRGEERERLKTALLKQLAKHLEYQRSMDRESPCGLALAPETVRAIVKEVCRDA